MPHSPRHRWIAIALSAVALVAAASGGERCAAEDLMPADHIVVHKAERKLYLYGGNRLLGIYHVALGLDPLGHKESEGDFRTPEGHYFLSRRNTRSDYFLSIQVSYPNSDDIKHARRHRLEPGGAIMIHGLPNTPKHSAQYYSQNDWTDGCIALSNSDMVEIWMRAQDSIPIDILP